MIKAVQKYTGVMAIRTQTCFIAVCDDCGAEFEHDFIPHWLSAGEAAADAAESGEWWSGDDDALLCYSCKDKPHAFVSSAVFSDDCGRCGNPADEHEVIAA